MRTTLEEFRQRRRLLANLSYQDEKPRLSGFYEWMQSVPELRRMTDALSSKVDVKSLIPPRGGFPKGPQTKKLEDVLAVGLHLLQQTTRQSLHTTAHSLSIRGGSTGQSYTDVCMEKYIEPLLEWIEEELEKPKDDDSLDLISPSQLHFSSDTLSIALQDAEALLQQNGATSALDRIHTAMHAHLRAICETEGISCANDANLTALFKALREQHPAFVITSAHSDDVVKLQRAIAAILDVFNPLRNRASVAHPNSELLPHDESMLAINVGKSILKYLDAKLASYSTSRQ